ncbi:glycine cleavage system protein GcvH [Candidatus Rariloculus sp.]|uniref:glycine cleavage system protein GcvH n=1 Tax=Candidatus Rariloculus sp. TaxID=3101265 RepID=UPI003D11E030
MNDVRYTDDHEWLRPEDDGTVTMGITEYAQEQLGDIVFVELPEAGATVAAGEEACVIESVKAAAEIRMPLSGEVVAVNDALADAPETVNEDPLGAGWFIRVRPDAPDDLAALRDQAAYDELLGTL